MRVVGISLYEVLAALSMRQFVVEGAMVHSGGWLSSAWDLNPTAVSN